MVHNQQNTSTSSMGQAGLCGSMAPSSDSWTYIESSTTASNGTLSELQASLSALSADAKNIDMDELVGKLRMVVQENLELKETITQNNIALRQQLGLVARWSQQCELQQRQQKEKVAETNQKLLTVQREYDLLKARDTSKAASESHNEMNVVIHQLKQQLEASESNVKTASSEINKYGVLKSKLETDITLLKRDLTTAKGEQERLLLERFEHMTTINELREQIRLLKGGAMAPNKSSPTTSEYEALGEASPEYELKRLKVDLKNEQDTTATLLIELQDTRTKVDKLEGEVKKAKEDLSSYKRSHPQTYNPVSSEDVDRKTDVGAVENKRLREESAMLRDEVETLESALSDERTKLSEERAALLRSHTEVARLKKEMSELRAQSSHRTDKLYDDKIKTLNEQYDGVTAKLLSYEEVLGAKNDEIAKLKKQLGQSKAKLAEVSSEGETIAVLRAQVEVYHADFKAEREAREAIATDREKLRDELRHLHQRNTQLVDELEAYQRRHFDQRAGSEEKSRSSAQEGLVNTAEGGSFVFSDSSWEKISGGFDKKEEESKKKEPAVELDENLLYCPKCNKSFTEISPLEAHVNRCLDEDL